MPVHHKAEAYLDAYLEAAGIAAERGLPLWRTRGIWVAQSGRTIRVMRGVLELLFVRLFQSPKTNPHCAQLIFNAHDPTILGDSGRRSLGRDQIWFTGKNAEGATTL